LFQKCRKNIHSVKQNNPKESVRFDSRLKGKWRKGEIPENPISVVLYSPFLRSLVDFSLLFSPGFNYIRSPAAKVISSRKDFIK
jgi:hypothetical protein